MAVRIDVEGGTGGLGGGSGPGGDGGHGGSGGHGGAGGPPGSYTTTESYSYTDSNGNTQYGTRTVTHWGSPGAPGRSGHHGSNGSTGDYGDTGSMGVDGNVGSVQFIWKDSLGKVIEAGGIGYNLRLVSMEIVDSMNDGIFEPLEEIIITNVTLLNDGDMSVPAGTIFAMLSSNNITAIEPNGTPIPNLAPGQVMVLTHVFRMKLADVPLPTEPGPLKTKYTFNSNATLLKRQFLKSAVTFGVDVAWPIAIQSIASPTQMARKETRPFLITIMNNSLIPYAASPETIACIVLHFAPGLIPNDPRAVGAIGKAWSLEIPLAQIDPAGTVTVSVDVSCWDGSEFFDRTPWKAELLLRGRLIEFSTQAVRTCPDWYENFADVPQDVIMFTADHFSLQDYLAWKSICHTLKLGLWMWDSERFRGISADAASGEPHGQGSWRTVTPGAAIVFPSNPNGPQGMNFADIIAHFRKFPMSTGEIGPGNFIDDAGFLFFGGDSAGIDKQMASNGEPIDIADWNLKFEGKHLPIFKPDDKDIMDKAVSLTKKIGEKDPGFPYRLMAIEKEVEKESFLKYSYGTLIIRRIPFKKYSKFVYAPRAISTSIGSVDLNATSLPLLSPYGQCMSLLISVLPVQKKLHSLATENHPINFTVLEGKAQQTLWPTDLLKVLLYRDLRSDLEHDEKDYPHALALSQAIIAHPDCLKNLNVRLAAFYALERLAGKKSIFSSNKPINNIKDAIKVELFKMFKEDEYKQMKKSNEASIKDHKKLRMHQYFHDAVAWLFEKNKKK
jgi:hypothetical protein